MPSRESLALELEALPGLSRPDLLERYQSLYNGPPPSHISQGLLRLAIAYRLQEQVLGGLNHLVRKRLLDCKAPVVVPAGPGTVLMREWQGIHHRVTVHADRVEYAGQSFRSLSEVARLITGVRRSGPAFFGLRGQSHGS